MLQFLLDTDHLTLFDQGDPTVCSRLAAEPSGTVGISIVTVEEYLRGRLAQLARARDGPARIHQGDPTVCSRLAAEPSGTVGISIVTVEEYLRGRLAQLARARDGPARIH